jgi:hypothetical protein
VNQILLGDYVVASGWNWLCSECAARAKLQADHDEHVHDDYDCIETSQGGRLWMGR